MNKEKSVILFSEKQRFKQWWIWLILVGINGMMLYAFYSQIILGINFGDKPMSNAGLIFALSFSMIVSILFVNFRLETLIKQDGIYVRFFPIHLSFRHIAWFQIEKAFIRQYKPLKEYGGWGIRGFGKNKALNMSGTMGLQLELKDGKKLLIGTNKAEELATVLPNLGIEKLQ